MSFEATKDNTFEEYQVIEVAPGVRLLRFSLVYGANASGKSNLLMALNYLREFWFERKEDMDQTTEAIPFLLDTETPKQPSEFEMKFYIGSTKFWYILSLDKKKYCRKNSIITRVYNPPCYFRANGSKDNQ